MINILIVWFIAGILLLVVPGLMYNSNTIDVSSFIIIILVGVPILLASIYLFSKRNKLDAKDLIRNLKSMFIISAVISLIIFLVGALGFFFENLFDLEPQTTKTMLYFGILFIFSIISWIYVERSEHDVVSRELVKVKVDIDHTGNNIEIERDKLVGKIEVNQKYIEDSKKNTEQNKDVLSKRRN